MHEEGYRCDNEKASGDEATDDEFKVTQAIDDLPKAFHAESENAEALDDGFDDDFEALDFADANGGAGLQVAAVDSGLHLAAGDFDGAVGA